MIKISKTVYPTAPAKNFNDWCQYFWGQYKVEQSKIKEGWDKNILIPRKLC